MASTSQLQAIVDRLNRDNARASSESIAERRIVSIGRPWGLLRRMTLKIPTLRIARGSFRRRWDPRRVLS